MRHTLLQWTEANWKFANGTTETEPLIDIGKNREIKAFPI
jgi:hypothetical protein